MLNQIKKLLSGIAITCSLVFISYDNIGMAKASKLELTMWTWKVAYIPGFKAVAEKYYKKTGIKVNIEAFTPDDSYRQKVRAAANGNSLPDIIHTWAEPSGVENAFVELSTKIDDSFKNKFLNNAFKAVTISQSNVDLWAKDINATPVYKSLKAGQMYGLPLDVGNFFMIYGNKKILQEAGLKTTAPKTWEEFVSMMETVKSKTNKYAFEYPIIPSDIWQMWAGIGLDLMYNGLDSIQKLMDRKANLSNDNHAKIVKVVEELAQKKLLLPGMLSRDIDTNDQSFAIGKVAFTLGGTFTLSNLVAMGMKQDTIYSFPIPALKGSKHKEWKANPFTLTMLALNKKSPHEKEALDFIKFLSSDKHAAIAFANHSYTLPAIKLGDNMNELNPTLLSMVKSFAKGEDLFSKIKGYPNSYHNNPEWKVFETLLQKLVVQKVTTKYVVKVFNEARAKELEVLNSANK